MRHVSLTCKNHPELRWSCKEIAWSGFYNGSRSIFFNGAVKRDVDGNAILYEDRSGTSCNRIIDDKHIVEECNCPSSDLILAPEDHLITR